MAMFNVTTMKTASNGVWQGDNPLHSAFPLLIIQTILILIITRSLALLLKPLRQPKVVAEIIGGILLGPSALGRNKAYLQKIFPSWSSPILETVADIGLLFFLFLVGLELDLTSIRRSGRKAASIALAGISLPFICGIGTAFVLRKTVHGADDASYAPFLVFMGVALSITAFPVLARILAELKLLTTPVGETAMAAAAFNDVAAWILLALAVALSGEAHKSPVVSLWVLLCGLAFVFFMLVVVRPAMAWLGRRSSVAHDSAAADEVYIAITLAGVLASGFVTDLIGIHAIFGGFVFGLTIPKDGEFSGRLIERIEDFVSGLLLPLYFASSGLKTNVAKIRGAQSWGLLGMTIGTACFGKILGTVVVAVLNRIPAREALTLGVLMNTKGLVELIVLNIGKERKVLNDETFAILVLMALFTTFITTPTVMAIYKPARGGTHYKQRKLQSEPSNKELRILACLHGPNNIPSVTNLIETIRGTTESPLKLYIMHLVELTERPSSIAMVFRERRNGLPFRSRLQRDRVSVAFGAYGQLARVRVRPMTAVSAMASMHEDICNVAEKKRTAMLILPFHKRAEGDVATVLANVGPGWRAVNQRVLNDAPCSVAVLVDRGLGAAQQTRPANVAHGVCVLFFGGPDDREALVLGGRMAEHPGIRVNVVRFKAAVTLTPSRSEVDRQREQEVDEEVVAEFQQRKAKTARYEEREGSDIVKSVVEMGRSGEYELMVVGQGRFPSAMVAELADVMAVENAELGLIGDILASSGNGVVSSVLIVQQYNTIHAPVSKIAAGEEEAAPPPVHDFSSV